MNSKDFNYIPDFYFESIFKIPYDFFLNRGVRSLFFDLDNTLIENSHVVFNDVTKNFLNQLKKNFQIMIISNASKLRLQKILQNNFDYIYLNLYHKKPSIFGFNQALRLLNLDISQVLMVGDQLKTDVLAANRMNITSILVKPLNLKSESIFSRFNRFFFEKPFLKKMKKTQYLIYESKFQHFDSN